MYFNSNHCLGSHEHIQNCRKWDTEIKLQLLTFSAMCQNLARTVSVYELHLVNQNNFILFIFHFFLHQAGLIHLLFLAEVFSEDL